MKNCEWCGVPVEDDTSRKVVFCCKRHAANYQMVDVRGYLGRIMVAYGVGIRQLHQEVVRFLPCGLSTIHGAATVGLAPREYSLRGKRYDAVDVAEAIAIALVHFVDDFDLGYGEFDYRFILQRGESLNWEQSDKSNYRSALELAGVSRDSLLECISVALHDIKRGKKKMDFDADVEKLVNAIDGVGMEIMYGESGWYTLLSSFRRKFDVNAESSFYLERVIGSLGERFDYRRLLPQMGYADFFNKRQSLQRVESNSYLQIKEVSKAIFDALENSKREVLLHMDLLPEVNAHFGKKYDIIEEGKRTRIRW